MSLFVEVGGQLWYNPNLEIFEYTDQEILEFEYTLKGISKWEARFKVPFLHMKEFTFEQMAYLLEVSYVGDDWEDTYVTKEVAEAFALYIKDPQSATTIQNDSDSAGPRKIVTTEVVYSLMFENRIPLECENWNYNRLNNLIAVMVHRANPKKKKRSLNEIYEEQNRINDERLKELKGG